MRLVIVSALVMACSSAEDLEKLDKKVEKLETELAGVRQDRQHIDRKLEQLVTDIGKLELKLEEAARKPLPSYTRPARREPDRAKTYSIAIDGDPFEGPADALVTIVKAYEYACPYCEKVRPTMAELAKQYGKDLRIVYKQMVVHPQTATAPALAICAAAKQQKFAKMDALLWEEGFKQRKYDKAQCWDGSDGCPIVDGFAKQIGLNMKRFRDDMADPCMAWQRDGQRALAALSVTGTPAFFINGRYLSGAQPYDAFATVIDEELAKAKARVAQGTSRTDYYKKHVIEDGQKNLDP